MRYKGHMERIITNDSKLFMSSVMILVIWISMNGGDSTEAVPRNVNKSLLYFVSF